MAEIQYEKVNLGKVAGDNGKSAYEIWLDNGNTGTEEDFLISLQGERGKTPYIQDGNWWIDGVDTDVKADAEKINLSEYVKKEDRDGFVREGILSNALDSEPIEDPDRFDVCNWLGAVPQVSEDLDNYRVVSRIRGDAGYIGIVLATNSPRAYNFTIPTYMNDSSISSEPIASIPTKTPTVNYAAANKEYVDNLPKYLMLTDEEKTSWTGMIGAVGKQPFSNGGFTEAKNAVFALDVNGNEVLLPPTESNRALSLMWRDVRGISRVSNPINSKDCANKDYVDNLPDYLTLTDEQKAKWRNMICTTQKYYHRIRIADEAYITYFSHVKEPSETIENVVDNALNFGGVYVPVNSSSFKYKIIACGISSATFYFVNETNTVTLVNLSGKEFTETVTQL